MRAPAATGRKGGMRGRPVLTMAMLLAGWSTLRVMTWASPLPAEEPVAAMQAAAEEHITARAAPAVRQDAARPAWQAAPVAPVEARSLRGGWSDPTAWQPPAAVDTATKAPGDEPVAAGQRPVSQRMMAGHTLMLAAGLAQMNVPPEIMAYFGGARQAPTTDDADAAQLAHRPAGDQSGARGANREAARASRWSADGWLLWRDDSTSPLLSGRPSYGRSQAGAVIRYRLAPASALRPQAHLRASSALQGAREREVAAGLSARPLPGVPVRLVAEARVSERAGGTELRPAAFAVTELAPQALPGRLVAEGYAQAGYVGGDVATAFVDGQARIERRLAETPDFDLRAGAGAWGGAQQGSARLDVGPTASVSFRLGEARGRVAADYRLRVAGDARPASGPALTLSAGF